MKSQDSQGKKLEVTEAVMHALHGTDFVVDDFKFSVGDRIDPAVENLLNLYEQVCIIQI